MGMSHRDVSMLSVPPVFHVRDIAVEDTAEKARLPHQKRASHFMSAPCSLQHNITRSCPSHTTPPVAHRMREGHCHSCGTLQPPADQQMPAFLTCGILDLGKGLPVVLHLVHAGVGGSLLLGNGALPSLHDSPAVKATTCMPKVRDCDWPPVHAPLDNLPTHHSSVLAQRVLELQTLLWQQVVMSAVQAGITNWLRHVLVDCIIGSGLCWWTASMAVGRYVRTAVLHKGP